LQPRQSVLAKWCRVPSSMIFAPRPSGDKKRCQKEGALKRLSRGSEQAGLFKGTKRFRSMVGTLRTRLEGRRKTQGTSSRGMALSGSSPQRGSKGRRS